MKKILILINLIAITFVLVSCSNWKVNKLSPNDYLVIDNGNLQSEVKISSKDNLLKQVTFNLEIYNNSIYLYDNILHRVQIIDHDGKLKLLIGAESDLALPLSEGKNAVFDFGHISALRVDDDHNIYIQNQLTNKKDKKKADFLPSYILVFDKDGKLQYTLGQDGSTKVPFYYIENMFISKYSELFVISRAFDTTTITAYKKQDRFFKVTFGKKYFLDKVNSSTTYCGQIENIDFFRNGKSFLISVAYYHKDRFKYRKIFEYDVEKKKLKDSVLELADPRNVLFHIIEDKYIYLWNMDNGKVKFSVYDLEHNLLNKIGLDFDSQRALYRDIKISNSGNFFTYKVFPDCIKITSWK